MANSSRSSRSPRDDLRDGHRDSLQDEITRLEDEIEGMLVLLSAKHLKATNLRRKLLAQLVKPGGDKWRRYLELRDTKGKELLRQEVPKEGYFGVTFEKALGDVASATLTAEEGSR